MENTQMKPAEMLEQVNKAIAAVLVGGQSYKIGSRSLTRADLSMLKSMRDDLEAQVAAGTPSHLLDRTEVVFRVPLCTFPKTFSASASVSNSTSAMPRLFSIQARITRPTTLSTSWLNRRTPTLFRRSRFTAPAAWSRISMPK